MPKSIKWLLACAFLLLLLLTSYRILCISLFKSDFPGTFKYTGAVLWYGFRFDGRLVGGITLFLLLLSIFPATHLFKTSLGKYTAMIVYSLFIAVLLAFYVADFASICSFHTRLHGQVFSEVAKNTEAGRQFSQSTPWFLIIPGIIASAWIYYFSIKFFHKLVGRTKSGREDKLVRGYWQTLLFLICLLALWGRMGTEPLKVSNASKTIPATAIQLSITPVESFFSSLSDKKTAPDTK